MTSLLKANVTGTSSGSSFLSRSGMPPTSSPTVTLLQRRRELNESELSRGHPYHVTAMTSSVEQPRTTLTTTAVDDLFAAMHDVTAGRQVSGGRTSSSTLHSSTTVPSDLRNQEAPADAGRYSTAVTSNVTERDECHRGVGGVEEGEMNRRPSTTHIHQPLQLPHHPHPNRLTDVASDGNRSRIHNSGVNGGHQQENSHPHHFHHHHHHHQQQQQVQHQYQRPSKKPWIPASASYRLKKYENVPLKIADYEPGLSSLAQHEPPLGRFYNPPIEKPGDYCKYIDHSSDVRYRLQKQQRSLSPSLSDSSIHDQYRKVQKGGDIPISGLRCPTPPETPKTVSIFKTKPLVQTVADDVIDKLLDVELRVSDDIDPPRSRSPISYLENIEPNVSTMTSISDWRLKREMNAARKLELELILAEERRKRIEQDAKINKARRHSACFLLPSRCAPVSLDRYSGDEFDQMSFSSSIPRRSPSVSTSSYRRVRAKARAIYAFQAQTNRELSLHKGDIVYLNRVVDDNWFEGEHHGLVGIFPTNYVEVLVSIDEANAAILKHKSGLVRITYDFEGQTPLELSLRKGDWVTVLRQLDSNWYEGRIDNRQGLFPICYAETAATPPTSLSTSTSTWSMNVERTPMDTSIVSCESETEVRPHQNSCQKPTASPLPLTIPSSSGVAAAPSSTGQLSDLDQGHSTDCRSRDDIPSGGEQQVVNSRERSTSSMDTSGGSFSRRRRRSQSIAGIGGTPNGELQHHDTAIRFRSAACDSRRDDVIVNPSYVPDVETSDRQPPPLPVRHYCVTSAQRPAMDQDEELYEDKGPDLRNEAPPVTSRADRMITSYLSSTKHGDIEHGVIAYTPYYVVYPYSPCDEDELTLTPGDVIYVTESFDDGWLVGISQRTNEYGSFPSTCVCKLRVRNQPRLHQHHHQRHQLSIPIEL